MSVSDLKAGDINPLGWEAVAADHSSWRQTVKTGVQESERQREKQCGRGESRDDRGRSSGGEERAGTTEGEAVGERTTEGEAVGERREQGRQRKKQWYQRRVHGLLSTARRLENVLRTLDG
eukprot:TRINITY_DN6706_c0_g1_i4.p1 TRINITY_DN6706_c0_g1~~TRINITY_DN6706_c0_g1_i4.p1  ORF type:complete len:121 (-),score=31.21 TRINITY_DN6706_c0_g1_i4:24-386(-)